MPSGFRSGLLLLPMAARTKLPSVKPLQSAGAPGFRAQVLSPCIKSHARYFFYWRYGDRSRSAPDGCGSHRMRCRMTGNHNRVDAGLRVDPGSFAPCASCRFDMANRADNLRGSPKKAALCQGDHGNRAEREKNRRSPNADAAFVGRKSLRLFVLGQIPGRYREAASHFGSRISRRASSESA